MNPDENLTENEVNAPDVTRGDESSKRNLVITAVIVGILIIAGVIFAIYTLSGMDSDGTGKVRDIFIIFMAVEFLIIGVALVVLIVQLAALINLLNNEVRPILKSTSETVNTLKGTTQFLSDNMVGPVIKLNEYLAGLKKLIDMVNIFK